jgi:hypothetical protein
VISISPLVIQRYLTLTKEALKVGTTPLTVEVWLLGSIVKEPTVKLATRFIDHIKSTKQKRIGALNSTEGLKRRIGFDRMQNRLSIVETFSVETRSLYQRYCEKVVANDAVRL